MINKDLELSGKKTCYKSQNIAHEEELKSICNREEKCLEPI